MALMKHFVINLVHLAGFSKCRHVLLLFGALIHSIRELIDLKFPGRIFTGLKKRSFFTDNKHSEDEGIYLWEWGMGLQQNRYK